MVRNKVCFSPVLQAQAVALTVAQAFTVAFELWQVAKEGRHRTPHPTSSGNDTHTQSPTQIQAPSLEELFYQRLRLLVSVLNQPQCSKDIDMSRKVAVNKF